MDGRGCQLCSTWVHQKTAVSIPTDAYPRICRPSKRGQSRRLEGSKKKWCLRGQRRGVEGNRATQLTGRLAGAAVGEWERKRASSRSKVQQVSQGSL